MLAMLTGVSANAGLIVVSGDTNIGNSINGSSGASVVAGNGTFFSNLLGGGTKVVLQLSTNSDSTEVASQAAISAYYTGLGDTVTTLTAGAPVTSANLAGANLLISFEPDAAYGASQTSAISSFLNGGGTVLFTAEFSGFDPASITNVNTALTALGSPLSVVGASDDLGFHTATGSQIKSTPLSSGVTSFGYAATSEVTGGTAVFTTTGGPAFLEYASTAAATPEPSTTMLLGSVLIIAGVWRRLRPSSRSRRA